MSAPLDGSEFLGPTSPKLLVGYAQNSPASPTDPLYVVIQAFGSDRWGPCPFMPKGSDCPVQGDQVLVGIDDEGNPWVLVW